MGVPALITASIHEQLAVAKLLDDGSVIRMEGPSGNTALLWAVKRGDLKMVRLFLDSCAQVSQTDTQGLKAHGLAKEESKDQRVFCIFRDCSVVKGTRRLSNPVCFLHD